MFSEELRALRKMGLRAALLQALNFVTVIATALAMWKGLSVWTNTESPVVVVLRCVERTSPTVTLGGLACSANWSHHTLTPFYPNRTS